MTVLTDAASRAALLSQRGRGDAFLLFALTLSFALAMLGLGATAHPRPEGETLEATQAMLGP